MRIALAVLVVLAALGCSTPAGKDGGSGGGAGGGNASGGGTGGGSSDAGVDAGTPLRILVMFHGSQSLAVTDPNATRIEALRELMLALPNDPSVAISVMAFSGSTIAYFTHSGAREFDPMPNYTTSDRNTLLARLTAFSSPGDAGDSTDFVAPLADAYSLTANDVSARQGSRYAIIFLSDGRPTSNQDDQLLCGDAVKRLRDLRLSGAGDVQFNTVHVFSPLVAPTCSGDAGLTVSGSPCTIPVVGNRGVCPLAEVDEDALRLRQMSVVGGGQFRDFRTNQPVSFTGLVVP